MFRRSLRQGSKTRNKTKCLGSQFVDGAGGGDVERPIVGIAPIQVSGWFGHLDGSKMTALRIPNPNALGASDVEVGDEERVKLGTTIPSVLFIAPNRITPSSKSIPIS